MIPIALKDTELQEDMMSCILIKVRNLAKFNNPVAANMDASSLEVFPEDEKPSEDSDYGRPYMTLVMELGVRTRIPNNQGQRRDTTDFKNGAASSQHPAKHRQSPDDSLPSSHSPKKPRNSELVESTLSEAAARELIDEDMPTEQPSASEDMPVRHPRCTMVVYGCSSSAYKVVDDPETFKSLLTLNTRPTMPTLRWDRVAVSACT